MALDKEKLAKTIDDEELDEVAGGSDYTFAKDCQFLNALGGKVIPLTEKQVKGILYMDQMANARDAWNNFGVDYKVFYDCDLLETTDRKNQRKNKLSSKRFFKRIGTEPENRTVRTNRVVGVVGKLKVNNRRSK